MKKVITSLTLIAEWQRTHANSDYVRIIENNKEIIKNLEMDLSQTVGPSMQHSTTSYLSWAITKNQQLNIKISHFGQVIHIFEFSIKSEEFLNAVKNKLIIMNMKINL